MLSRLKRLENKSYRIPLESKCYKLNNYHIYNNVMQKYFFGHSPSSGQLVSVTTSSLKSPGKSLCKPSFCCCEPKRDNTIWCNKANRAKRNDTFFMLRVAFQLYVHFLPNHELFTLGLFLITWYSSIPITVIWWYVN